MSSENDSEIKNKNSDSDSSISDSNISDTSPDADSRPTFYYKNDRNRKIRAGGILYYKFTEAKDDILLLMINCNGMYEDFGGKTDKNDECIEDTIAREAEEESNNIFVKYEVYRKIVFDRPVYSWRLKYAVFIEDIKELEIDHEPTPEEFGTYENHAQINRTVVWVPYSLLKQESFINEKLHYRLRFKKFFNKLEDLFNKLIN